MLLKRIQRFREAQQIYMSGLDAPLLAQLELSALPLNTTSVHVEDSILFMPSELPFATRRRVCNPGLSDIEDRLRFAEAHDALDHLRHHLRNRTFTNKFKVQNVTGQKHNTRAREVQNRIDDRVKTSQVQYCRARAAMVQLRGPGHWETTLQVLNQSDVRALNERELTEQEKEDERRVRARSGNEMEDSEDEEEELRDIRVVAKPAEVGESRRRPSWIWFSTSNSDDMQDPTMRAGMCFVLIFTANLIKFDLALRVEWAKSQAHADRWNEEVVLLDEEMRRVIEYCGWKASWWKQQASQRGDVSPELAEGLLAFAEEQAAMEDSIAVRFASQWAPVRKKALPLIAKFWGTEPDGTDIIMGDSEEEEIVEFMVGEEDDDGGGSDFDE